MSTVNTPNHSGLYTNIYNYKHIYSKFCISFSNIPTNNII